MKILNLYAGIGGNRKNWDGEKHDITHVEWDEEIAKVLRDHFPNDKVIVGDAHEYLKENYDDYDFIWASPPCPTHSQMRRILVAKGDVDAKYPDMKLYQEVIFLQEYFEGDFVVENVDPYYDPLIKPQKSGRHLFWSNFTIPDLESESNRMGETGETLQFHEERLGFDLSSYDIETNKKRKMLRNCVDPKIGEAILKARSKKQTTLKKLG